MNIAFTGHVDHGKSSLIGRVLLETGEITEREYQQYEEEARAQNRSDATLAFLSDDRKEERERGLSIMPSYSQLDGSIYNFTLIDCPGHHYYTGSMIKGVSQSDTVILVVSVKDGVQPLTKEHALISHIMGGGDMIVAISKMDTVDYDQEQFKNVKGEVTDLLGTVYGSAVDVSCVPVSAVDGCNVVANDAGIDWYDRQPLLEEFNALEEPEKRDNKPFRLPVDEKHTMSGIGTTIAGTVQTGTITSGQKVVFQPSDTECEVRSIEMFHEEIGHGVARDNIGVNLTGVNTANAEPGDVCGSVEHPPSTAREITAEVTAVQRPPAVKPGVKLVFHAHSLQSPCEVTGVSLSKESETEASEMDIIDPGQTGQARFRFPEPIAVEREEEYSSLGTFLLRDNHETLAYGKITAIE
jgi:elongation factor 1-alpha